MPAPARRATKATPPPAPADPFAVDPAVVGLNTEAVPPLDETERAELEAYRKLAAETKVAPSVESAVDKVPAADEKPPCRHCYPGGWTGTDSGQTCQHGQFWRYGKPSADALAGRVAMNPEDFGPDEDVL